MNHYNRVAGVALGLYLLAVVPAAYGAPQAQEGAPSNEPSKALYWQGHEALGRSDWSTALERFRELEQQLGRTQGEPVDAALYWQAYALVQARRAREASAVIDRLRRDHPSSAWIDDAVALAARSGRDPASTERQLATNRGDPREEDALMALDALLAGGDKNAVPLLRRVLAGDHGDRVKRRAIFVLSQIDAAAAEDELRAVLEGNASAKLKAEAIRMIAAGGNPRSLDRLLPLYRSSSDAAVKRGVLDAFLIGDRHDLLLEIGRTETDPRRRRDAIHKLGAMGRTAELKALYEALQEPRERRTAIEALGVAGATAALIDAARVDPDASVRAAAIRAVGVAGGKDVAAVLLAFYTNDQPEEVRRAVMDALMIADETEALVALYRKETDPRLKRDLLHRITTSDGDAALELIDQALER